jgi:ABC-2 type transport system ATP-binding protein
MIEMKGVCKQFGNIRALDGLDIHVAKGSIYGLIGTNGAGKTTAIRHLTGMLRPDQGEVLLDGQPVWENSVAKQRVGVIPDEIFFPHGYTMKDMAKWYGRTYVSWDETRFQKVAETFGLDVKRRIRTFSKGMKKQAAFSLVMATRPDFLFLDEPIDGLDPIVRKQVWKVIVEDVAERETTVLVSSHNLKEMEGICDSIGILSRGRCVLEKDLDDLRGRMHKVQVAFPGGKWPEELERKFAGCAACGLPEGEARESAPMAGVTPTTGMAPAADGLEILHREHRGSVDMLILRGDPDEIRETFVAAEPLLFDVLPLSLEEIFIYEIGGDDHDISELII